MLEVARGERISSIQEQASSICRNLKDSGLEWETIVGLEKQNVIRLVFPDIELCRVLQCSPEQVWDLLTDTHRWVEWGPSIMAVQCPDRRIRRGSRGRIRAVLGLWLPFTITNLEPGRRWSWRVAGIPATGHRVEPLGESRTLLAFSVPMPAAPYLFVCYLAMNRIERYLTR
jgi:hypothetical protein